MPKGRSFVARVLLLAAVLMAAQPFVLGLGMRLRAAAAPSDWGPIVICTAHGAVTLPDAADGGGPAAPTDQKAPDCPYCALGCGGGLAKVVLAESPPQLVPQWDVVEVTHAPIEIAVASRQLLRLLTSPPRAPPSHA